ncbi:MAG: DNA-directed RNA polymerase subunit beta, partial [Micrococcales bacterium]|nr:DNA-directed RNA polymerase subunit beta [Micrococcales bacterium]
MAASRIPRSTIDANAPLTGSRRVSFGKIQEPLEVPDLLGLQLDSFDWLLGHDRWRERLEASRLAGRADVPATSGLEEVFSEISPIEDFSESMSLSFRDHRFEPPKCPAEECKEKDFTYAAP